MYSGLAGLLLWYILGLLPHSLEFLSSLYKFITLLLACISITIGVYDLINKADILDCIIGIGLGFTLLFLFFLSIMN